MAIQTSVGVRDNMSAAFLGITGAINTCLGAFMDLQSSTNEGLSTAQFEAIQSSLFLMNDAAEQFASGLNDAGNEQEQLNNSMRQGVSSADGLLGKVKGIVATYAGWKTVSEGMKLSDELTLTEARLNMMNDGLQTTVELQNMVMAAAQRSRGAYLDMAGAVAKLGNNAGAAFGGNTEQIVAFAELVQKQFAIAGASATESANAMLQLTQALGSGVLRGDELNSIFEQAPNLIMTIADYMGVSVGQIRELASEGQITADIVKNAMFASADDINAKFEAMPMTWGQIWTNMQNNALAKFQPVLAKLNEIANSDRFNHVMDGLLNGLSMVAFVATEVVDFLVSGATLVQDNWSMIEPIFWGIVAAVGAYVAIQAISAAITTVTAVAHGLHAAALVLFTGATWGAATAQLGLNGAMYACPIVWIIALIAILIIAIVEICQWIAEATGVANSWFGVMMGGLAAVGAFIYNTVVGILNFIIGIGVELWNLIATFANFFANVFNNPVGAIINLFAGLFDYVLGIVQSAAELIDTILGSDLSGAVAGFRSTVADAVTDIVGDQVEVMQKISQEDVMIERIEYGSAFSAGAEWGDNISNNVSGMLDGFLNPDTGSIFTDDALTGGFNTEGLGTIADNTALTADNTGKALEITEENMAWMKDIAEREVIDRTVFKDISVNLGGVNNTVNNMADLDGVADYLGNVIQEQMLVSAEGVHA